MVFEKPNVEFVELDPNEDIATTSPGSGSPSLETCDGVDAPSNNCAGGFME